MRSSVWLFMLIFLPLLTIGQTVLYDFEDGNIVEWTQFPENKWETSSASPISGTLSLKHIATSLPSGETYVDRISKPLPIWNEAEGSITWRFKVRHRTNPSGTNHWAIFLSSDNDAEGMAAAGNPNGYVLGLNLTSTDDILRLYSVTNGVFNVILSSSINWETQIGSTLTSIGAIEIERKLDGTFSLKVSTTGSFSDMTPQGSVFDNTHTFGGYFGVYFSYTSSAAGNLSIDDFSISYKLVNPNDHDVQVVAPAQQVENGTISSLEINPEEGVDVFKFVIQDQGTSDNLPTYSTKLRFNKVDSPQSASFRETIGGVILRDEIGEIPIQSTSINDSTIELLVEKESMVIEDNTSREFTLAINLKQGGVVDGSTIQLSVENENHGWETDIAGSEYLENFPEQLISGVLTVQVVPTHLNLANYPIEVVVNSPFNVGVAVTDIVGNIASSYSSEVTLGIGEGEGELLPLESLTVNAENGLAYWTDISYSNRDVFSLIASADGLSSTESEPIAVINDPTSHVVWPSIQPEPREISSLLSTPGQAVEVFRFNIVDDGENDEVPTYVRQIYLKRPSGTNMASFSGNIAGVIVKIDNLIVPIGSPYILTSSISIPIPENSIVIPDGESVEVSISVYLKTSGLIDGSNLRFMIDSDNHGFIADEKGSTFTNTFPSPILSNNHSIDVKATRLSFSNVPSNVGLSSDFSVEVSAVDAGGSLDINAVDSVFLSKNSGDGSLSITNSGLKLVDGKATWSNLSYNLPQPFTLLASAQYLDDVISPLIYCSDINSRILPADIPLESGDISSTSVEPEDAVEVFRFKVEDLGTTDGLPTYITQMVFQSFGVPNTVSLSKSLSGVKVMMNGSFVSPSSVTIATNTITVNFDLGEVTIPDGSAMDFYLGVYLSKGRQIDKSTICLQVPVSNQGWQTSKLGSGFPSTFDAGIVGPTFQIVVNATSLEYVNQPFITKIDEPFSLMVAATDLYGSIDTDADFEVELALDFGPDAFQAVSNVTGLQNGMGEWDGLVLESVGNYRFLAETSFYDIASCFSEPVWCGVDLVCHFNNDFDDGYPQNFPNSDEWNVSSVSPISGTFSLKHALIGIAGESQLPIPLSINNLGDSPMEWSFVMRNGNWDPTADNTFWFVLTSDSTSFKPTDFNGYAVGVNLSGSSDILTLWKVNKGGSPQVVIQSSFNWDENETVGIKVTRTPNGEWSLWLSQSYGIHPSAFVGKAFDASHIKTLYFGPYFKYTSSRAGELWIDDLNICGAVYPPIIQKATLKNLTTIDVTFSSAVNADDVETPLNYKLYDAESNAYEVVEVFKDQANALKVSLTTEQLPLSEMMLRARGIRSLEGSTVVNDSISIGLGASGTFGNVIINEIMSRPSPVVGLPNFEFIELFNRSSSATSLNGWKLIGNSNSIALPNVSIEPNGYLILSNTSGADAMSYFGQALGVSSFPALLDGGMFLAIYDNLGNTISWVDYSDSWYGSDVKKAGGYSLERIDPNNLVEGKANWTGSNDISGGTPGRANSVLSINPDRINPKVVEVKVLDETNMEIGFSEPMDSLSVTLTSNYSISKGIGNPIFAQSSGPKYKRALITFSSPLANGEIYDICFDESIIDFSGNSLETNCINIALPVTPDAGDIVINEVLFNPFTGGVDFVEIFNRSDKPIDLNRVWIANRDRTTLGLNEFYLASDSAWLFLPNSYAVLTENPVLVDQFYLVENAEAMVWTRKMPSYPNDFGYVLILDEFGAVVDELSYSEKMHNKLLTDYKGVSLERINPDMPTNDPASWESAAQTSGFATPTAKNSQFADQVKGDDAFTLSGQVFSPDGDGYEDVLLISYELPESGSIANIMVYDSKGRSVKRLAANATLGTSGNLKWDGSTDSGSRAPIGAYIVYIETFDLKGNVKRYKKTVVVATRLVK